MSDPAFRLGHVPDLYQRYPGEDLTLYTRVDVTGASGYRLQINLPAGLRFESYTAPDFPTGNAPQVAMLGNGERLLLWTLAETQEIGTRHEFQIQVVIESVTEETSFVSRAVLSPLPEGDLIQESTTIIVTPGSRYLRYLPALYESDVLMGRFLMLFDSFWHPLEGMLNQIPEYFDPATAPRDLLPWLASWFQLMLDEAWPEARRRRLLESVVWLYRQRGTRQGLQEYLEIYTGVRPQIIEHRARNFRLGTGNRLGFGVAMGTRNVPHTFTVILPLPPITTEDAIERERLEQARLHTIKQIIDAEKPAHTTYHLQIES